MDFSFLKRMSSKYKNNKFLYYVVNYIRLLVPRAVTGHFWKIYVRYANAMDSEYILNRVNYYNKLPKNSVLAAEAIPLKDIKFGKKMKVYFFDFIEIARFFPQNLKVHYLPGDIDYTASKPSITKSRPVEGDNSNSVILKLEKIRHFLFLKDPKQFSEKTDMLIGRGKIKKEHRVRFFEQYFNHPMCDLGEVARNTNFEQWRRPRKTIAEHLDYKFILCLEGNDVASNLKWVMSTNSLAVCPKPKFETWFMEGTLIPNVHYVQIKDDYSDLEERMLYYINNPEEAQKIINNAHQYIEQFKNKKRERLISILVLRDYFSRTNQL
jgi:hypothetical protein